ncbi:MAG: zinc-dependent alcohol dehydrogenase [Nocardioides sp.]
MPSDGRSSARAYWTTSPGRGELRDEPLARPGPGEALVRTLYSGISTGTELLVYRGLVPPGEAGRMRAPHQAGEFGGAVKYGYLSVGTVLSVGTRGSAGLIGQDVFCLYPHQDRYVVPVGELHALPAGLPRRRAVLTGAIETAVNALWDAPPRYGDQISVVGGGLIGGALLGVLSRFPLGRLQLVDIDESRAGLAAAFGAQYTRPEQAAGEQDLVFHASGSAAGLNTALGLAGEEAEVIELSWYGTGVVPLRLGGAFHSRRLSLRSSQVGAISPARRSRRTHTERLAVALDTLRANAFDVLLGGTGPFADLPATLRRLADGDLGPGCHVVEYPHPADPSRSSDRPVPR